MKVLSSKYFDVSGEDGLRALGDYFYSLTRHPDNLVGKRIVVNVELIEARYARKKSAARQLEELLVNSAVEDKNTPFVWEKFGYRFCFTAREYFWNGMEIHITANEALFLYRRLVPDDDTGKMQTHYLRNMRRRLGEAFLAEAAE
jgi:hypothetical protein